MALTALSFISGIVADINRYSAAHWGSTDQIRPYLLAVLCALIVLIALGSAYAQYRATSTKSGRIVDPWR